MSFEITEAEWVAAGYSPAWRESRFVASHPEWSGRTSELLAAYFTCQDEPASKTLEYEFVVQHVRACPWCIRQLGISPSR
jgi:hypothetical protein